jgi:hypothetical protein
MPSRANQIPFLIFMLGFTTVIGLSQPAKPSKKSHPKPNVTAFVAASKPFIATGCDATLWDHVYHPKRLVVVQKCISVTGTIYHAKKEADGDDHIQLKLDDQYAGLLNDRNNVGQKGCLVLEPICQNAVTQTDAIEACRDFHSDVEVPKKGSHVRVLGSYVLDSEQPGHGWMEIHPVTSIEVVQ